MRQMRLRKQKSSGFTLVELLVVVAIILIVSAIVVPSALTSMKNLRLQGAARDFSSLMQQDRMRSVKDNAYYAIRTGTDGTGAQVGYVDIGASSSYASGDPVIQINSNVSVNPGGTPGTTALNNLVVPTGSITLTQGPPIYFNSRGLPCLVSGTTCPALSGNTPAGYVTYLQSSETQNWMAVTVTPAGRVQVWYYDGNNWNIQSQ